ncbi:sensor histidine kinase [Nonomuraea sediminis]|uniref:sensor histidine kinase n=1 Tax=Nonomuraea sediminis TaxID=2835864 RepID=UPI001BDBC60D|nr:HAMP domain-containing sensor histidine kinase [Nonomuraea sediminis]
MTKPPGRTVRQRFTALYGAVFLLSGAVLLAIAYFVTLGSAQVVPVGSSPDQPATLAAANQIISQLHAELSQVEARQSRQLLVGSVIALVVMAAVSLVLGRLVAGRVLRPLRTITAATRRISADNLHERLAVPGPADEVKDLADTIDGLLERLEGAFATQRRFVANASHELRTPLATMRASLDVALAKPEPAPRQTVVLAGRIRTELDQVDQLLEGFLTLARAQHADPPEPTPISLRELTAEAMDARAADIADKNLTVRDADLDDRARTRGNRTLLARMVQNLIDNAIIHNHDGGWIQVATTADDTTALLVVDTGGDVLDPEQVARLTEPFQRLGADRTGSDSGSGLGLSIVAAIASAHGGALELRARPEGGLRATVSLPVAVTA